MKDINMVILLGRVGADPKVASIPSGKVASLSVATTEKFKDRNQQQQERTEWHRCVFYSGLAELAEKYIRKGNALYIQGRKRTREFTPDGATQPREIVEIVVEEVSMVSGSKQNGSSTQPRTNTQNAAPAPALATAGSDEPTFHPNDEAF